MESTSSQSLEPRLDPVSFATTGGGATACAPQATGAAQPGPPVRSAAIDALFATLRDRGIRGLLWKGGQRLGRVVSGEGDVDLMVGESDVDAAERLLRDLGFIRVPSARWRSQPFIGDWFAIDSNLGRLLHVQLYERLIIGSAWGAQIEVPDSAALLGSGTGPDLPVACPADAAVFRLCQAALTRSWHPGRSAAQLRREAEELAAFATSGELADAAARFSAATANRILSSLAGGRLGPLRRQLRRDHRSPRRAGGEGVPGKASAILARLNRGTLKLSILPRRAVGRPAPIIAVVGSDGSGKSTVSRRLVAELGRKFDTRFVYFGTGTGPGSILRWPLVQLRKLLYRSPPGRTSESRGTRDVPSFARALWAVAVARERRGKMRRATRAAAAGWLVVADRYPQAEHAGIHDGPRLGSWAGKGGLRGRLARWEERVYRSLATSPPDLVLHLDVSLDCARERRPDESRTELRRRIEVARDLRFGGASRITVNADRSPDAVFGECLARAFARITP